VIASFFVIVIGIAYSFAPALAGWPEGIESVVANIFGPLIVLLAILARFPAFAFCRHINNWIGFLLAISPLFYFKGWPSALVIQAVTGLWLMGFSMLSTTSGEGGGWRRTLEVPATEEKAMEWS
jgi:hypothetical protein